MGRRSTPPETSAAARAGQAAPQAGPRLLCAHGPGVGLAHTGPCSHSPRGGTGRTLGLLEALTSARGRSRFRKASPGRPGSVRYVFLSLCKGDCPTHLGTRRCLRFEEGRGAVRCPGGARGAVPPPRASARDGGPHPLLWDVSQLPGARQRQTALCFPADS